MQACLSLKVRKPNRYVPVFLILSSLPSTKEPLVAPSISTLSVWFLVHNGYYWHAYSFMQCMEAIIYHIAAGYIEKDLLQCIIPCFMASEDYPESLKLEIIHAIDGQPNGIDE